MFNTSIIEPQTQRPNFHVKLSMNDDLSLKQGRIHGYPSRVRVGRGSAGDGHQSIWAGAEGSKKLVNAKKVNSRKSVRWSAVPVAPAFVYV